MHQPNGVEFASSPGLVWNGDQLMGLVTKTLGGQGPVLSIDFTTPTTAFGVDLETYDGFPNTVTVTVFAADDTTVLGTAPGISLADSNPVFVGFEDPNGIGLVLISSTGQPFSAVIDNLTFGAVPEPTSWAALTLGVAGLAGLHRRWGRRVATKLS